VPAGSDRDAGRTPRPAPAFKFNLVFKFSESACQGCASAHCAGCDSGSDSESESTGSHGHGASALSLSSG